MAKSALTIGVVSDTHMPRFGKALPAVLRAGFAERGVELIVHCGDLTDAMAIPVLEAIAPLEAVARSASASATVRAATSCVRILGT